jgi:hypothetical protein
MQVLMGSNQSMRFKLRNKLAQYLIPPRFSEVKSRL